MPFFVLVLAHEQDCSLWDYTELYVLSVFFFFSFFFGGGVGF